MTLIWDALSFLKEGNFTSINPSIKAFFETQIFATENLEMLNDMHCTTQEIILKDDILKIILTPLSSSSSDRNTFCHGEFKPDNLVFCESIHRKMYILDWESAGQGDYYHDAASIIAGMMTATILHKTHSKYTDWQGIRSEYCKIIDSIKNLTIKIFT